MIVPLIFMLNDILSDNKYNSIINYKYNKISILDKVRGYIVIITRDN